MAFCNRTETGLDWTIPLVDIEAGGDGLYGNGQNDTPPVLAARGIETSKQVLKRLPNGTPDTSRKAKKTAAFFGISNLTQEAKALVERYRLLENYGRTLAVNWLNCGHGGWDAKYVYENSAAYWDWVETKRLNTKNPTTYAQIQVAVVKFSIARATRPPEWLEVFLDSFIEQLLERMENLVQVYLYSANYSGYCSSSVRLEPHAFLEGLAVQKAILKWLNNQSRLYVDWFPYIWANGLNPRAFDGLVWECRDFKDDGVHPGLPALAKISQMQLRFLENHPATAAWFPRKVSW
jgi:hypothetical protein